MRRVWIECYGVPLYVWTEDTFRAIGGQWGEVVVCEDETNSVTSFRVGRVLIDTCRFDAIHERLHLSIGSSGFDVCVREMGSGSHGYAGGVTQVVVDEHEGNVESNASGPRSPMQRKGWDTTAEIVALTNRMEERPEGRVVITPKILNEWSNCFSNSKTSTATDTDLAPKEGRADHAVVTSERTQSWDYDGYRVVASEVTSRVRVGLNARRARDMRPSSRAQLELSKKFESGLGLTNQGPHATPAVRSELVLLGPEVERVRGNTVRSPHLIRPGGRAAVDLRCDVKEGEQGGAVLVGADRSREACGNLDSVSAMHLLVTGGYHLKSSTVVYGAGAMASQATVSEGCPVWLATDAGASGTRQRPHESWPCAAGRESERLAMGRELTGKEDQGDDSGGIDAWGTPSVSGGLAVTLSGGGTGYAVACDGNIDESHEGEWCCQLEGDGIRLGDLSVELPWKGGGLGEQCNDPKGEGLVEGSGIGGYPGLVDIPSELHTGGTGGASKGQCNATCDVGSKAESETVENR
ncbi:hypothetical protein AHAS_Ahas13G0171300 [Arachis hypogaea]